MSDDDAMQISRAIKAALTATGYTQEWLATQVGMDAGVMSKLVNGRRSGLGQSLELVRRIEDALGVDRGDLLRAAGYVGDGRTPTLTAAIAADPSLTKEQRAALRGVVRSWAAARP